ncbi:erythromycin esterase family protein [Aureispira anguillae]|uniref:Erythromycin esterase family protein n=1 Tax=Aureispira anguillae TaxID=2864201 RepID=A0A915YI75_9BACT|nr:erythromycin esterase family protein [Aureispira anguillae]BDS13441.1 erythromycin esterase family protein [Aureispira anguillae]
MHRLKTIFILSLFLFILKSCTNKQSNPADVHPNSPIATLNGEELFIEWGKENAIPFDFSNRNTLDSLVKAIAEDVSEANVVVLSEGFHNCEEMLALQYELITYLVQEKGFNTIATESGLPESKYLNDYIHGEDSIPYLWKKSIDILYSEWERGRAMVEWLRKYNQSNANKVDYFGADIGGFYNDWNFPFQQIFSYLDSVDVAKARTLKKDMSFYLGHMTKWAAYHYMTKLTAEQQNKLVLILDELIQSFHSNKDVYLAKSSKKDYLWVLQCVKSMRMAENYYRNYQNIKDTTAHHINMYAGANGREIAMAENIKWMLSYKEAAKIIVINHVIHTKTASQYQGEFYRNFTPMGQLLKQELKEDLFIIGMVYGRGFFWNKWQAPSMRFRDTIPTPPNDGLENTMQAIAAQNYYLNMEDVPLSTYSWFKENTSLRENDYEIKIKPSEWNACFYLDEVNPAKLPK